MSQPRGNGQNGGHFYSNITQPVKLDCNFIVDATNGNGLGIRSLKSNGYVRNVFMHTTASPGTNDGYLNPNPASGYILVQFNNNYKVYTGGFSGFVSPVSGTPLTATTAGLAYIIVSLGTATAAQWLAAGVPPGVVPAVGVSFIATATGTIGGSAAVEVPATNGSGVASIDVIGNANLSFNTNIGTNGGAWLLLRCLDYAGVIVAPAAGSVLGLASFFDISSVTIDGL